MPISEINKILSLLADWYNGYDFNGVTEEQKHEIITAKFIELGVFNIDFGDMKYNDYGLSQKASAMAFFLDTVFADYVTYNEKINQLLHNPNIVRFALGVGNLSSVNQGAAINSLLLTWNNSDLSSERIIKSLEIIRDTFKYVDTKISAFGNILSNVRQILNALTNLEIDESQKKQADELSREIIKIIYDKNLGPYMSMDNIVPLFKYITDDDYKISNSLNLLQKFRYNDDAYNCLIGTVKNFDKKLDLCRKTVEYQENVGRKYFANFMLYFAFKDTIIAKTEDEAKYLLSKLYEVVGDEKLKKYVDSFTIKSVFTAIKNDNALLLAFKDISEKPSLAKLINANVIMDYIKCFQSDKIKLQIIVKFYAKGLLSIKNVESLFSGGVIKNRSLFLDKSLMESIYVNPEFKMSIAQLLLAGSFNAKDIFKKEEMEYILDGRLDELLEKYKNIGIIDKTTLEEILKVVSKYVKNITMDDLIKRISNNPEARDIIQFIATKSVRLNETVQLDHEPSSGEPIYSQQLYKFSTIFPRTRFGGLPDLVSYQKMPIDLCRKFNVKTWNQLIKNPLFNRDENAKRALVEIVGVFSLFDNDPDVENRKHEIISLFEDFSLPFSKEEMELLEIPNQDWVNKYFDSFAIKRYKLRAGVVIPDNFANWLSTDLTLEQMTRLKKETGNFGSEINKFLSPYARVDGGWKLRNGVQIDSYTNYLKPEMSNEEYMHVLNSPDTPSEVINFLSPYEEVIQQGFKLKQSLPEDERTVAMLPILKSNLNNRFTFESLHRMFDGMDLSFHPDFYQFFLDNLDQILLNPESQAQLKNAKSKFDDFKNYYAARGNSNPNYNDLLTYLDRVPYNITFGNEEFAQDAKNTKVSEEAYSFYEGLLTETRKRHLTTVPRHEKIYKYVTSDGETYHVMAKVLRADDPFNLLVGETKFTNCCQTYGDNGEECMRHAGTSQNGGIFATYLIVDGVPTMLTQSWFWTNEAKACLDNVEATSLITGAGGDKKMLLQDIATFAIRASCDDIIKSAKTTVDAYIAKKTEEIMNSDLSDDEKQEELRKLEIVRQRQTIKIITVGDGCDDLHVKSSFPKTEPLERSYGPKGYTGYRDSTGDDKHKQHIIIQTSDDILPIDDSYVDIPMFRDDRRISVESASNIRFETLRKITDIESYARGDKELQYTKNGEYKITAPNFLAKLYECSLNQLHVVSGEDWYYIYSIDKSGIVIHDFAKGEVRISDESMEQDIEMTMAFEKILGDAIILDESGSVVGIKPITVNLKDKASYLLYLKFLRNGDIENIDGVSFADDNDEHDLTVCKVTFKPTEKKVRKLLANRTEESNKVRRTM